VTLVAVDTTCMGHDHCHKKSRHITHMAVWSFSVDLELVQVTCLSPVCTGI